MNHTERILAGIIAAQSLMLAAITVVMVFKW